MDTHVSDERIARRNYFLRTCSKPIIGSNRFSVGGTNSTAAGRYSDANEHSSPRNGRQEMVAVSMKTLLGVRHIFTALQS